MKTMKNTFYNSSPNLGEVPAGGRGLYAADFTDSSASRPLSRQADSLRPSVAQSTVLPSSGHGSTFSASSAAVVASNFGEQLKCKAATVLCTLCSVFFLAACSETDDIAPVHPDAPLTITAIIPGDVWGVATRSLEDGTVIGGGGMTITSVSFTDWKLHYTDHNGLAATYAWADFTTSNLSVSLTTGSDLVWAQVDAAKPMHLTAVCDNGTADTTADDYTLHTSVASATAGTTLAFTDAMTPTVAMLTVNFTLSHNMTNNPSHQDFTITVSARAAADSYNPMTAFPSNVWPAAEGDATATTFTLSEMESVADGTYTVTGTMLLPQQEMGKTLTVTYGPHTWTLDLSTVTVSGIEIVQKAYMLFAGQHLTLNLSAGLTSVNAPSDIQIEAFTAADGYESELGGVAKTYEYDAATNTYIVYHEKFIEAALADRKANNRTDAKLMYGSVELTIQDVDGVDMFVVDGTSTDLATVKTLIKAAIAAGKTHILVPGNPLAAYSDYRTVVGEAIRQLTLNEDGFSDANSELAGIFTLVLPEVTEIEANAFNGCYALRNVSAPEAITIKGYGFNYCHFLESVNLPKATTIGKKAFQNCNVLTSVSLPVATEIGESAFLCTALTTVSLPAATSIGNYAFSDCTALTTVSLPAVTTIGEYAFRSCTALETLTFGVVNSVADSSFEEASTTTCDLTLGTGSTGNPEAGENKSWAGNTWKSITLK